MFRGLLVFGLAIGVIGAPLATDLCQAACAMRSADATAGRVLSDPPRPASEHHSCHAEAPPSGPALIEIHACGHTDELPGVDRPELGTAALAIMPIVAVVAPTLRVALSGITPVRPSPPPLAALTSQLRV
jgi:hypothetical protein